MQLPSLPAAEGVTMEATVTLECSLAHEMMVMENVPVNLAEIVLPLGSFAEMLALERHAEMPVLVFDHPTLGQCSAYPIASRNIKLERLPTLAHLLHANSCVSRRNLLPVVHVG